MRLPYYRYVVWQYALGKKTPAVQEKLTEVGYVYPADAAELEKYRREFIAPLSAARKRNMRVKDPDLRDIRRMAEAYDHLQLSELFQLKFAYSTDPSTPPVAEDLSLIFEDKEFRRFVECMLLCRVDVDLITAAFKARYNIEISNNAVVAFERIFWNICYMKGNSWEKYFSLLQESSRELELYKVARYDNLDLLLLELGLIPDLTSEDMLKSVRAGTYAQAMKRLRPDMALEEGDLENATRLASSILRYTKYLEEIRTDKEKQLATSITQTLKTEDIAFPQFRIEKKKKD